MPSRSRTVHLSPAPAALRACSLSVLALVVGLVWLTLPGAAHAADATDIASEPNWTGTRQSAAIARKEAFAALSQGRRECQRERKPDERKACLKQVEDDHAAMMKRVQALTAKR